MQRKPLPYLMATKKKEWKFCIMIKELMMKNGFGFGSDATCTIVCR